MDIRSALESELEVILDIERRAFGEEDEAELVRGLLVDPTAQPLLNLLAFEGDDPVGHILFTAAQLKGASSELSVSLLAPLAIIPEKQGQGVGGELIGFGLKRLAESGVDLVFVLGHPGYYPRHGFQPAGVLGLDAPYPIPEKDAGAWMVQALRDGLLGEVQGEVACAQAVDKPEYWRE